MAEDKPLKKPFTDEQQDFLMDYLFEKYMNDMMKSKERSEDFYNQPPTTDPEGNILMQASLPGNLNKRETELLMGESPMKKTLPGNLNKNELEMLMGLIDQGVKDTKKEGIMMAQQYEQGGDLNYVIEMMANETDPDKLEELKMIIREMLGTTPYMSIRQSPTFKLADGGIVHLAPGGSVRTPSTYESKAFEEYLAELGPEFQKKDPDTGKIRGSKGSWNKFVLSKGIKPGSTKATELLNDMRKAKGLSPYISTDMALKGYGKDAVEIATGTKTGQVGTADRDAFYKKSKTVFKEADNTEFKSKNDKYKFIEKQLVKAYPTLAGTTALATFISKRALGGIGAMMPSELEAATLYSPEDMDKMLGEMAIREKFE